LLRTNTAAINGRIQTHDYALGSQDGTITLLESDDPNNFGGFSLHRLGNIERGKVLPIRHAEHVVREIGKNIDVIKIDTEGAEWDILTTIDRETLSNVSLIMGELHGHRDFALLDFLQPMFHIAATKQSRTRLFNFYAINRNLR
jgi:FkbM family methyltransferase